MHYISTAEIEFIIWETDTVLFNCESACTHMISNIPEKWLDMMFNGRSFTDMDLFHSADKLLSELSADQTNEFISQMIRELMSMELIRKI